MTREQRLEKALVELRGMFFVHANSVYMDEKTNKWVVQKNVAPWIPGYLAPDAIKLIDDALSMEFNSHDLPELLTWETEGGRVNEDTD